MAEYQILIIQWYSFKLERLQNLKKLRLRVYLLSADEYYIETMKLWLLLYARQAKRCGSLCRVET